MRCTTTKIILPLLAALLLMIPSACKKAEESEASSVPAGTSASTATEVSLSPDAVKGSGLEFETLGELASSQTMHFTGTVEANQQATQQVTPLVSGRVERVHAALGDRVRARALLAIISSPEVAEMHGNLLEAHAKRNLAASTLKRTQRLTELGATAGKDLAAAEAEMQTANAEVRHLENSLQAVGAVAEGAGHSIAAVALYSPIGGVVTERNVNPGSGVEPGKPLFTIADLSNVWIIANVPESQVASLRPGAAAEVRAAALGARTVRGQVSFIDPNLNEQTRTARVRVSVANPGELLKIGMFCDVSIAPNLTPPARALMVPDSALQRIGDKTVVFVDAGKGKFSVREVTLGAQVDDHRLVLSGVKAGERVVTSGSFVLKSQMLKSEFAEGD